MKELTAAQLAAAKLLSPHTIAYYENEVELLTEALCTHTFGSSAEQRELAVLSFVEMQAKRNLLIMLLSDASEQWALQAQATSQSPTN
jgi:hypothetical protein